MCVLPGKTGLHSWQDGDKLSSGFCTRRSETEQAKCARQGVCVYRHVCARTYVWVCVCVGHVYVCTCIGMCVGVCRYVDICV